MKLRNKKTGEIIDLAKRGLLKSDNDNHIIVYPEGTLKYYAYDSLTELNAEWEDYKPAEPLIKDKEVRMAVRAWARAESEGSYYGVDDRTLYNGSGDSIEFWHKPFADLETGEHYTITELCGEEEE